MTALDGVAGRIEDLLAGPDAATAERYPGDPVTRQPVHSVYVPGQLYTPQLPQQWGERALDALAEAGGAAHLMGVHGLVADPAEAARIGELVERKLRTEPIEDLRIDFEDGYGDHGDAEDGAVVTAARAVREAADEGLLPPFIGIRFKCLEPPTRARGLRTLDLFVSELASSGPLPQGLVLTLPKVTTVAQVEAMVIALEALEAAHGLDRLGFEIQVETPQAILGPDGVSLIGPMIGAGGGRVTGMPYGTYDYSASLGIAAAEQSMEHPAADYAKSVMQVATAGTGVRVSDGSTNVIPVGERRGEAWALHGRLVMRSLKRGFYQGWDLHPAQLPSRYAATYAFFRAGLGDSVVRLDNYLAQRAGDVMDEPATAKAMASFLLRGLDCGAVEAQEVPFSAADLRELLRRGGKIAAQD